MKGRALDLGIGLLLLLLTTVGLQLASRTQGFTRDEGYYFTAAENHVAYYEEALAALRRGHPKEALSPRFIDRYFGYNSEHPPLMKTLFGISWRLLHRCSCPTESGLHPLPYAQRHRTLGLLKQGDAMRLPTQLLAGLLVAAVYLLGARCWGRTAGLGAAGLAILLPRHVFHAQLACFDAPVAAMIFLITWAYLRAQQSGSRRWAVAAGVLLGLAHFLYLRLHPRIIEVGLHPDGSLRDRHLWHLPPLAPGLFALRMDAALDFAAEEAAACRRCRRPMLGESVQMCDAAYHRDCLACAGCGGPLAKSFYEAGGVRGSATTTGGRRRRRR